MTLPSDPSVSVIVPAYNEGRAIEAVLSCLCRTGYNVIVVDDGSSDETFAAAHRHPAWVLRHAVNLGQGAALQTGIEFALRLLPTRYVVTFDSDGQHATEDIERLLAPLRDGSADVVLGSRFLDPAAAALVPRGRRAVLRLGVSFTRRTTGLRVTDTHNGLRALTASAAGKIAIRHNRMAHASELLAQIAEMGLRYREVPVTISYTDYSTAKGQRALNALNILWDIAAAKLR